VQWGCYVNRDIGAKMADAGWAEMMHFSRVTVALITVSIGVVAQTPHGSAYFCPLTPNIRIPFLA
jgi:hypothetical protein